MLLNVFRANFIRTWSSHSMTRYSTSTNNVGKQDTFHFQKSTLAKNDDDFKKIPVCIVLGWAGGKDKHVSKYSNIYHNYGFHVIRFSPTAYWSVFRTGSHRKYSQELLDLITLKLKLVNNPIIVHTFSNAGTFIYRHFTDILHEDKRNSLYDLVKKNVKGLIFDSGPGFSLQPNTYLPFTQNVVELFQYEIKNKPLSYLLAFSGIFLFTLKHVILNLAFLSGSNYFTKNMNALANDNLRAPTLIYFSKMDRLVNYLAVNEFITRRLQVVPNLKIDKIFFEDTEHCSHYLKHKDVYIKNLNEFLLQNGFKINNKQ